VARVLRHADCNLGDPDIEEETMIFYIIGVIVVIALLLAWLT
jgi:hypothetical protein